jgi:endopeptidase La
MDSSNNINNNKIINKSQKSKTIIALENKVLYYQEIVRKTILAVQRYKMLDIISANDLSCCINNLDKLFSTLMILLNSINQKSIDASLFADNLQEINDELASLFKSFGTDTLEDLIKICIGTDYITKNILTQEQMNKYEMLSHYMHPISYRVLVWKNNDKTNLLSNTNEIIKSPKNIQKNKIVDDSNIIEEAQNLECFDLSRTIKNFHSRVYGIKLTLHCPEMKKTILVNGIIDEIMIDCLNYTYVGDKIKLLIDNKPKDSDFNTLSFTRFIQCLTLKELLVYSNKDLYNKYMGYMNQVAIIKQKTINQMITEFVTNDLYGQRLTLIQLLLKSNENEFQYLAYLLYDLLSNDSNGNIDTHEQTLLFDSLPWNVRKFFRDAMKKTIQYTNNLSNFDNNKIPLEQQICLMKASDAVKEKAMVKLKEIKAKAEDSGSKARQYLDGLLKIPFSIYKQEPILNVMSETRLTFNNLMKKIPQHMHIEQKIPVKTNYNSAEILKYINILKSNYSNKINNDIIDNIKLYVNDATRNELIDIIVIINTINKKNKLKIHKLCHSGKNSAFMRDVISNYLDNKLPTIDQLICSEILLELGEYIKIYKTGNDDESIINTVNNSIETIDNNLNKINSYIHDVYKTLDSAVHGHEKAKRQVERIIGQWINGEKTGYCFGFEGPPGVGKTSLAKKGIAECLKDSEGICRPFSFIAIGGSSNGSTLEGHNYTYVGSTWGRIVDILMDKKCMNPIIFIDELDKVSRTEHGKEIIGILTHLIDPTQNDTFQDKYFNGIELDLSKALFIFSYNDVDSIDKILLDRIHRIKFEHLSLKDKLVVTRNYILPEIFNKMGLNDSIYFSDDVIEYIIEEYTFEPGVRKLKEILFEIIGEINLSILKEKKEYELPIHITNMDIKTLYLKDRHEIKNKKIGTEPRVGVINGLWANSLGKGGVLPIEAKLCPSGSLLDLKLTGMQGDVMKESMSVARTLAWSLLTKDKMKELVKEFDETKMQGIHIHCPEGATPKDGPSAGTAITITIYSLLTNKKIKHDVAITGEICLQGNVTAIGGLDIKILGGIRAGVKTFIYPNENKKDFDDFYEKYRDSDIINGINFHSVEHINEVFELVFE